MIWRARRIGVVFFRRAFLLGLALGLGLTGSALSSARFRRYGIETGLSQNTVYAALQDSRGFMWFGTQDGLNRFDGSEFKVYRPDPVNPASLSNNFVTALAEDTRGFLWIGTDSGGLNRLDPGAERFTRFLHRPLDPKSLAENTIAALLADTTDGGLWIGTPNGLDRLDPATGVFRHYRNDPAFAPSLSRNSVTALYEDAVGTVWVGCEGGGLNRLDRANSTFAHFLNQATVRAIVCRDQVLWAATNEGLAAIDLGSGRVRAFRNDPQAPSSLASDATWALLFDQNRELWVGTRNGLDRFDPDHDAFTHFRNDPLDPSSLSDDDIRCLRADGSGGFWVGTFGGGLNRLDRVSTSFEILRDRSNAPERRKRNSIRSIFQDEKGTIWCGTEAGLHLVNRLTGVRSDFVADPHDPHSLSDDFVRTIIGDRTGTMWIGTDGRGVDRLDPGRKSFVVYRHDPQDPASLSADDIRHLLEGNDGSIWIATMGGGLDRLDPRTGRFRHYRHDPNDPSSLGSDRIYSLAASRDGTIWVGTWGAGVDRVDPATGAFHHYPHVASNPLSVSDANIISLFEDRSGRLWVGTRGQYLCRLDPENQASGHFVRYGKESGLPNGTIYAILEDDAGFIWFSHNLGLSRLDPRNSRIKTFGPNDGLQSLEFNGSACFRGPGGEMLFGGINGLNAFFPGRVRDNPYPPPVAITAVRVFDRPVPLWPEVDLSGPGRLGPAGPPTLSFSSKDKMITFTFAALHYAAPESNQYAYMLEGFDKDWNLIGNGRQATYTNLPPGKFTFRVKASNNDGLWNEAGASVVLIVAPPFWKTLTFQLLAGLTVVGILAAAVGARLRGLREQKRQLEVKVEERTTALTSTNTRLEKEIGDRLRAEEALRQEKLHLDLLFESAPEAIVFVDRDHRITRVNPEFTRIFGWSRDEVVGLPIDEVVAAGPLREEALNITRELDRGRGISFETRRQRKDGQLIDVVGIGAPIQTAGRKLGYFAIYRDISDRKRAEAALDKRAAQAAFINRVGQRVSSKLQIGPLLQEIVDAVSETFRYYGVHLFLLDDSRTKLKLQAMAGGYTKVLPRDLVIDVGTGIIGHVASEGRSRVSADVSADPQFVRLSDEITRSELAVPIRSGDRTIGVLDVQSINTAAFDETDVAAMETLSSQLAGVIENARLYQGMAEELAQRRRIERMLKGLTDDLARSNKDLEQFAYVASHDLQEPMRMVGSYVQLLARRYKGKLDGDADDFIAFAVDGATRMQNMINDLLAFSRVGTRGKPFAPTSCEAAVDRALADLRLAVAEKGAVITRDALPTVTADETQLTQLFQNLIGNAIKFQDRGTPRVHISAAAGEGVWTLSVRDNGIGIEPRFQERIFHVFERLHRDRDFPGTGIGLAICKRIVERHGGRIWVESASGQGSTFFFTLPRDEVRREEEGVQ